MPRLLSDLYHLAMALYYTARLAVRQKAVQNTYGYCFHLEQVSFVDRRFRAWLAGNPHVVDTLKKPVEFIDREPDIERLRGFPAGTLGHEYAKIADRYRTGELDYLRPLRLKTLPHEQAGLDLAVPARATPEQLHAWLVARRNIYMTTSHDLAHLVTGCDVSLEGEAIVAMYQFWHLRVPQNFMNMWNARLMLSATLNFGKIRRIRRAWRWVMAAASPLQIEWELLWALPLEEARTRIGLPREGMQTAPLPGSSLG